METMDELKALYKENLDRYNELALAFKDACFIDSDLSLKFENLCLIQFGRGLSYEACRSHVLMTTSGKEIMEKWRLATHDKMGIETELKMAAAACNYYHSLINTYPPEV